MMALLPRGPWCCEEGERLGVTVCPECAETSTAYQACMGPENKIELVKQLSVIPATIANLMEGTMSEEVNLDEVMSRRFELDEQITARQLAHKAELAPLVEEMGLCESFVKAELLKMGAQNWTSSRTGHHTHFMTKDSVTVEDMDQVIHHILAAAPLPPKDESSSYFMSDDGWAKVLNHIQATGLWMLLNKAVNKTAVKEMIEAAAPPPGVKYTAFKDLAWRRGKV